MHYLKNIFSEDLPIYENIPISDLKNLDIPQFSNEIYSVVNASGSVIELSNGKTYKRNSVLKVVNSAAPILVNPIDENITKGKVDKEMRQLGQEHADIDVNQPRQKRSTAGKRK